MLRRVCLFALTGLVALASALWLRPSTGEEPKPAQDVQDSVERDYSNELPRIAPKDPAEALHTFHVAEGFRIEQVASEPLVTDPVAMAFDENGRLFVVEMRGYSENENDNLGQIRLLVDTDEDGKYDKSTVYVDGLSWPTAVTCYDGGVFVGAAPRLFYFKDHDGDGRAEQQDLVYDGFGTSNVQGLLNTFKWGLDNRIHAATSSSGAELRRGDDPQGEPIVLRGRDFSLEPKSLTLQPTSGGAQHGLSFDAWGNKFVCSNSNHIQYVTFDDRYMARNPYLAAPSPRISIAADGPQADVFRTSPVEPWRVVRTRLRAKGIVPGVVEGGGRPAGYFTGATGVTIYRGHAWPEKYSNWAVVGDVGSNLIHRKRLEQQGLEFKAFRVDEKSEFVTSDDIWFRPVQFANAPDGTLYIADMYREVIEHPKSLPPVIKKHLDLTSGRDRGRIYRIVPEGFQQPRLPKLGSASTAELVATLEHPNGWHRETASRLLYERQDTSAVALLERLADESSSSLGRMHALYALDGLKALTPHVLLPRLHDESSYVREHAVRLAERVAAQSAPLRSRLYDMTDDQDLRVRYQLAFSLGELNGPQRNSALARIVRRDADNSYIQLAVFSSLAEGAGSVLSELAADASFRQTEDGREWLRSLAAQIGKQQRAEDVAALLEVLQKLPRDETKTLEALVQGLNLKEGSALHKQVAAATAGRAGEILSGLLKDAQKAALQEDLDAVERAAAVRSLRLGKFTDQQDVFAELLAPAQPVDVQAAALDTLAAFDSPQVADLLIRRWSSLSPRLRARAGDVLFARPSWLVDLLEAIQEQRISVGDLEPGRMQLLANHRDQRVRELASSIMAEQKVSSRGSVIEDYRGVLDMEADVERGRQVFRKVCAACHRAEGFGHEIAPSLAAMKNRGDEAILLNVLDPNREVNPQYLNYALITADGRSLSGMIASETATSVTLKRADNATDTVLRIDIDELRSTGTSLMPEGLEKQVDQQSMADLLAYLRSLD